jgi:hypothetical protein
VSSIGVLSIALGFCRRDESVHLAKGAEKAAAALIGPGGEQQRDRHWLAAGLHAKKEALIAGVLVASSTIAQLCQPAAPAVASVIRITLLTPRVAKNVVSPELLEAGLVALRNARRPS